MRSGAAVPGPAGPGCKTNAIVANGPARPPDAVDGAGDMGMNIVHKTSFRPLQKRS